MAAVASHLTTAAAHTLSSSTQTQAGGPTAPTQPPYPIPRGDVEANLTYFVASADGAVPYMWVETPPAGDVKQNYTNAPHPVVIHDIRGNESAYTLDTHAFAALTNVPPSAETEFQDDASIKANYYPEVEQLLLSHVPDARKIIIFDHTIRRSHPGVSRVPVLRVHIDQTGPAALERVRLHAGSPEEAQELLKGRVRIINVWRPLNGPVVATPLAVADSSTVRDEDVVPVEHRYPHRTGYTASVLHREEQQWYYLSGMTNDERLLLECFDSEGSKPGSGVKGGRAPHSAFVDPRTPVGAPGRESIEVRCLVFGP
jgi:hypothetical protein